MRFDCDGRECGVFVCEGELAVCGRNARRLRQRSKGWRNVCEAMGIGRQHKGCERIMIKQTNEPIDLFGICLVSRFGANHTPSVLIIRV